MKALFITMICVALLDGAIQAAPSDLPAPGSPIAGIPPAQRSPIGNQPSKNRVLPVHPQSATPGFGASSQNRQNRGLITIGGPATLTKNSTAGIRGTVKPAEGTVALNGNSMNRKH